MDELGGEGKAGVATALWLPKDTRPAQQPWDLALCSSQGANPTSPQFWAKLMPTPAVRLTALAGHSGPIVAFCPGHPLIHLRVSFLCLLNIRVQLCLIQAATLCAHQACSKVPWLLSTNWVSAL